MKLKRAAPDSEDVTVTNASSDGSSTSTTRLDRSITSCALRFKVMSWMSSKGTSRGASFTGWMLMTIEASVDFTPSLARSVSVV